MAFEHAEMPAEGDMVVGAHELAGKEQDHMLVQEGADVGRLRRIGRGQGHAGHLRTQRRREALYLPIARRHGSSCPLPCHASIARAHRQRATVPASSRPISREEPTMSAATMVAPAKAASMV